MKRFLLLALAMVLAVQMLSSQELDPRLRDSTLRVNYVFSGTDRTCDIAVDELDILSGWAGRRVNMKDVPLRGNGQLSMTCAADGDTLYRMSFSTLFQEWQATEEATRVRKSFENVFLLPMPAVPVNITVTLYDFKDNAVASLSHPVEPSDILIRPKGGYTPASVDALEGGCAQGKYLHFSGAPEEKIDIVIVPEGYTWEEMETFFTDAGAAVESLFAHEPFGAMKDRFNILAVNVPSKDSGVSVPREGLWKETAAGSHFDTFYSDRYLTTLRLRQLHDLLTDVPYEHIIILANTGTYGGGGIFNSYTLTTAHHPKFRPVVVHEFGHSFAGLADEYFYDDQFVEYYYPEVEPWEKNITTKADFSAKWQDLIDAGKAGMIEGGGYQSKGVWRGCEDCRMKTNEAEGFCPVCQQAIEEIIRFYTEEL